jgi:hypothetical protein
MQGGFARQRCDLQRGRAGKIAPAHRAAEGLFRLPMVPLPGNGKQDYPPVSPFKSDHHEVEQPTTFKCLPQQRAIRSRAIAAQLQIVSFVLSGLK